jgi:hypothetical protein
MWSNAEATNAAPAANSTNVHDPGRFTGTFIGYRIEVYSLK